jgi:bifunctional non-homologous end joining protein LigD
MQPQLLNPIEASELQHYIASPEWVMQEKMDGQRAILIKRGRSVTLINRNGKSIKCPPNVMANALALRGEVVLDGELVGSTFYAFDLLSNGKDYRSSPVVDRHNKLVSVLIPTYRGHNAIPFVPMGRSLSEKRVMLALIKELNGEGVVFKRSSSPYTPGRPSVGGDQLKFKFYATASFIVSKVNERRSVQIKTTDGKAWGNVTIPPNKRIPPVGAVVEVRYLYAYRNGCVFQPVYLGERTDILKRECKASQLKFKNGQ